MVRFSCFIGHNHSPKPKKTLQPSFEAYHKNLQDPSHGHFSRDSPNITSPLTLSSQAVTQVSDGIKHVSSADCAWMSEDMKSMDCNLVSRKGQLKKSQSLGSGLYQEGRVSAENDTENEMDQGFSCNDSNERNGFGTKDGSIDREVSTNDKYKKSPIFDSLQSSCGNVNKENIFSIADPQHSEKEHPDNSDTPVSGDCAAEFSDQTPRTPRGIRKSSSLTNLDASSPISGCCAHLGPRSRSFEDLHAQDLRREDISRQEVEKSPVRGQIGEDTISQAEKGIFDNDNYDSCHYSGLAKDWIMPVVENVDTTKSFQRESLFDPWVELPDKDFKIKRIEEWVNDLQHCGPLEESDEALDCNDTMKGDSSILGGSDTTKKEDLASPGMEAAKRYISSLNAAATTAQLANHGLVAIPFLSAFVSLRVLNLSGNAIVRITAGALPRGLHTLNLSKNNISTIEGLRELTRLRVLDLRYNRILRIGHGLASCSSLKELYLAGNKISEVEGLHRLLKLTVLDLRFNKISTTKCLGQLAANYNSLQAISLEGNPAQKNVGDDQLKKHLQGLLPYLAYFNRQTIKANTLKESSDRSVRLGMSSHQFDRGVRPDHKGGRKGSHVVATHGRGIPTAVSPKPSKGRHSRLPPMGTKATTSNRNHYVDVGPRIMSLRQDLSMRRSRSEGTLGAS